MRKKLLYVLGACGVFAACNSDTFTGEDGGADTNAPDVLVTADAGDAAPIESGPSCSCDSDAGACHGTTCVYPMTTGACLVTAGQYVYWTNGQTVVNGGAVYRMNIVSHAVELVASGQQTPRGIAADDTNVYWTFGGTPGGIRSIPIAGGSTTKITDATDPVVVGVMGQRLYFGDSTPSVYTLTLPQGTPTIIDAAGGLAAFMHAGGKGLRMYWTANIGSDAGALVSAPNDGGFSRVEYSAMGHVGGLIAPPDETLPYYDYVMNNEIDSLLNYPIKLVDAPNAFDLAQDTTGIYWSEQRDAGLIRKRNAADASVTTLATESNPMCVAPLAPTIYWTAIGRMIPGSAPL